jgi:branched-chain amino acid transport system substrate-binding protein
MTHLLSRLLALFVFLVLFMNHAHAQPVKIALIEGVSGPFTNGGEAVVRNVQFAVDRINARGGVTLATGKQPLELVVLDSKSNAEEAISQLRQAADRGIRIIMQGNSSAVAQQLIEAIERHNAREPERAFVFLNYAAVEPSLTNERCSPWHFRFDAHADMRMTVLMHMLKADASVKKAYLIGQDYSFGHQVLKQARAQLAALRPDVQIVGDELHAVGRVKDFAPYAAKIVSSGAQAVITGNWGNDLTLLIKSAREAGYEGKFYTFYANALGAPAAIGEAGVGKVLAVAEWHPNVVNNAAADALFAQFRRAYPKPEQDYFHLRMQAMVEMLAAAIDKARSAEAKAIALALSGASLHAPWHTLTMRAADHQAIQPLVVSMMQRKGDEGVRLDNEGSGYGFKTVLSLPLNAQLNTPHSCNMKPLP